MINSQQSPGSPSPVQLTDTADSEACSTVSLSWATLGQTLRGCEAGPEVRGQTLYTEHLLPVAVGGAGGGAGFVGELDDAEEAEGLGVSLWRVYPGGGIVLEGEGDGDREDPDWLADGTPHGVWCLHTCSHSIYKSQQMQFLQPLQQLIIRGFPVQLNLTVLAPVEMFLNIVNTFYQEYPDYLQIKLAWLSIDYGGAGELSQVSTEARHPTEHNQPPH